MVRESVLGIKRSGEKEHIGAVLSQLIMGVWLFDRRGASQMHFSVPLRLSQHHDILR